jgi:hypothetical protein
VMEEYVDVGAAKPVSENLCFAIRSWSTMRR